jgi:opacity protein-like surface antigen
VTHNLGGEFIGDFAPSFRMANIALAEHPSVNSFMFNLLGMVPLGAEERFQPYVSAGIGGVSMRTELRTLPGTLTVITPDDGTLVAFNEAEAKRTKFGTNIGGGFFAYADHWGVRGDIRYYNVSSNGNDRNPTESTTENFTQALLSGLNYWRANLGVAFRW